MQKKKDWLIVWCLTPFSTVLQLHRGGQYTYPCIPGVLLTDTSHRLIFFPSHWLLSHVTIIETTDSGERGMNPVAMSIINPRKEYSRVWDRTSDLLFSSPQCYRLSYGARRMQKKDQTRQSARVNSTHMYFRTSFFSDLLKSIKSCTNDFISLSS